jgi:ribonucleoside-diphosphate reductase alpha chain
MSIYALSEYTRISKYSRYIPEKKRRETWKEQVDRVFDMHLEYYGETITENEDLFDMFKFAKKMVMKKKVLGSQRALQFGGSPILKKNERLYNCTATYVDRPRVFQESMFLLLCGAGVGFSIQKHHVAKLPKIQKPTGGKVTYEIPDSIEGWADAVGVLLSSYFTKKQPFPEYFGKKVEFDWIN